MFKKKNVCLIISVVVAILWMLFSISTITDMSSGVKSNDAGAATGTAIGVAILMPYLIISSIGTILHTIGGFIYHRGLVLAGLIVECVGMVLGITWGFGYIIVIIFGFIGYAKMKKMKEAFFDF